MTSPIDSFTYKKPPELTPEEQMTRGLALFHQGVERVQAGDKQSAFRDFCGSVNEHPGIAGSWFNMATALDEAKKHRAAVATARRCVELWADNPQACTNLGWYLHLDGQHAESRIWIEKALALDPTAALAWSFLGQHWMAMRDAEKAIECSRKAVELEPEKPLFQMALSFALMLAGQWEEGLAIYEWRFKYKLPEFITYPYPLWRGEPIAGQRLFIVSEQGLGDTLQFSRYVQYVKRMNCSEILWAVQAPLVRLMENNFKGIKFLAMPATMPDTDWFVPLISMPVVIGGNPVDWGNGKVSFRPLSAPPDSLRLKKTPFRKLHVGICWGGDPAHDSDRFRSAPLEDFLELVKVPNLQLYSLQHGPRGQEIPTNGLMGLIRDDTPSMRDVADTASYMRGLDLVITVDTSVAHLAGATGRPCWLLLPYQGLDWRWTYQGEETVWYPSVKLIRQTKEEPSWTFTLRRVAEMLKDYKP